MKIALDAMGGDNAPFSTIKGAVTSLNEIHDLTLILVGEQKRIESELSKYSYNKNRIEILDAPEVIEMNDDPVIAVKTKKSSSMNIALTCVKDKIADASVSAGNTGALIASSQLTLKRIKGVLRPAIAAVFPNQQGGHMVVLDVGATSDSRAEFLNQYAVMGSKYMEILFGTSNPRVGLLNIGTEEGKGNEITREAYDLLKTNSKINFSGNIESSDFFNGNFDVIVTDGFTGNMVLKTSEGIIKFVKNLLKSEVEKSLLTGLGAFLLAPSIKNIKLKIDSSEHGGAIFLGLNGISIKAHGNSDDVAIKNAIKVANKFAQMDFVNELKSAIDVSTESIES